MTNHGNRSKHEDGNSRRANPLPEEIRRARAQALMSARQAAQVIYCTERTWCYWESGQNRMHPAFWELWQAKVRARAPAVARPDLR